ncbi:glycosyltransferase family 2 protein [Algoriphagus sp. A40]|uniref:glycosyltransferase family 2 protein n=1 Tax=Algoriphagus sp. A40 TaxID=1945863 RepID=UPI002110A5A3|nr:glycosyltransferase family 2 protein [Algoriphagus sp. A40]
MLLTCFNRKEKTKKCLEHLFSQNLPVGVALQVFVCDDGSSDGTGEMLEKEFPKVIVVSGTGDLFWNGGMNLAWAKAKEFDSFDFFLWLNDDTYLEIDGLKSLLENYAKLPSPAVLIGACYDPRTKDFSFGGTNSSAPIIPNGKLQEVSLINGNLVLIPAEIDQKLNGLSSAFTHYFGDYDYGLRAQKAGFPCYTSTGYLATCESNEAVFWGDSKLPFSKRWKLVHDTKGLALREYFHFLKIHFGLFKGYKTLASVYFRVLSPSLFLGFKKSLKIH